MAQQYYEIARRSNPGMFKGGELAHRPGSISIPEDAGDEVRQRRSLNALRARLQHAIKLENYEEAARLRDELAAREKDVVSI